MKPILLSTVLGLCLITSAFAQEEQKSAQAADLFSNDLVATANAFGIVWDGGPNGPGQPGGDLPLPPPCQKVNPDDGQKTLLRNAMLQHQKDAITLKANVDLARLDYVTLVLDPSATPAAADAASAKITDTTSKLVGSQTALDTTVLFRILKPEQRESALACMKIMHDLEMRRRLGQTCPSLPPPPTPPTSGQPPAGPHPAP